MDVSCGTCMFLFGKDAWTFPPEKQGKSIEERGGLVMEFPRRRGALSNPSSIQFSVSVWSRSHENLGPRGLRPFQWQLFPPTSLEMNVTSSCQRLANRPLFTNSANTNIGL